LKRPEKNTGLWALFVLMGIFAVAGAYQGCAESEPPVKITAILSLTGPGSNSAGVREAMQMAVEEVNAQGGVAGRSIALNIQDSRSDPKLAVNLFRRLEKDDPPDIYIAGLSSITSALAPLAEEHHVPLIGIVTTAQDVTKDRKWTFRFYFTAQIESTTAMHIISKLNIKELGLVYLDDPYGYSCYTHLKDKFESKKGRIKTVSFTKDTSDFNRQIDAVIKCPAIYMIGYVNHIRDFIPQVRKKGYQGIIIVGSGGANSNVRNLPAADKVYVAAPALYNPQYVYARQLRAKFQVRFRRELEHQDATGYDLIKLLAGLLSDISVNRENTQKRLLQGFAFPCAMGNINVAPGSNEINFDLLPGVINNGQIDYRF
jgi:branched-chain amino acid transport system substrate-binding protein